jgi:hypothetical protein
MNLKTYLADDGSGQIEVIAETAADAAQQYVDGTDWGATTKTTWVNVYITDPAEPDEHPEMHKVAIDPAEPGCHEPEHEYRQTGVSGHGGGVRIHEVCPHCGTRRITDTWAQDPQDGFQGLDAVEYRRGP